MAAKSDLDLLQVKINYPITKKKEIIQNNLSDYFDQDIFFEAQSMALYYSIFYCLERSARDLIVEKLKAIHGGNWWVIKVPEIIQKSVRENMQKELDAGVTIRSDKEIDYTTFGELGEIVKSNWTDFGDIFKSVKAYTKIMTSLNVLRGPIAHCCKLSEDEIDRLNLVVRDWMRIQSK
jgi:hypothetical protein